MVIVSRLSKFQNKLPKKNPKGIRLLSTRDIYNVNYVSVSTSQQANAMQYSNQIIYCLKSYYLLLRALPEIPCHICIIS